MISTDQLDDWEGEALRILNEAEKTQCFDTHTFRMSQVYKLIQALRKSQEDKKLMMEALEFYEDRENESSMGVNMDGGDVARAALEKVK